MQDYDWSQFTTTTYIQASPEKVYQAWATAKGMETWFLKKCDYQKRSASESVQSGDGYTWTWYTKDDYRDSGKIIECQSPNYFKFTFGPSTCAVHIKEQAGATLVELIQEGIPTDEKGKVMWHLGCQTGWTYFFANLKAYLEHGIDLREKDKQRLTDCSDYNE